MILGLTGGFGCGKSSVLACFKDAGWQTLNTDDICAELYEQQNIILIKELRRRWQEKVFYTNGKINKAAIAEIVFEKDSEMQWLCSVLYPLIKEKTQKLIKENTDKDFIVEVPMLFEAGWDKMFDKTVAVWIDEETQKQRLLNKGFSLDDIARRNSKQLENDVKLEKADLGILNTGDLDFLKIQCNNLINKMKEQK